MSLKIKEGAKIFAYGQDVPPFTSESELSQPILEHLKERFPDDVIEENDEPKTKKKEKPQ